MKDYYLKHLVLVVAAETKQQQGLIVQVELICKDGDCLQVEDDEKLKKRKERFGIQTGVSSVGAEDVEVNVHLYFITVKLNRTFNILTHSVLLPSAGKENEAR